MKTAFNINHQVCHCSQATDLLPPEVVAAPLECTANTSCFRAGKHPILNKFIKISPVSAVVENSKMLILYLETC